MNGRRAVLSAALVIGVLAVLVLLVVLRDRPERPNVPMQPAGAGELGGTVWRLIANGDHSAQVSSGTLYIDGKGLLVADDECVVIGGQARVNGTALVVTDQLVRFKGCVDQYGPRFSGPGAGILKGASRLAVEEDVLTITKGRESLRFDRAPERTVVPVLDVPTFVGSRWTLVKAVDADGSVHRPVGRPELRIDDDGSFTAGKDCDQVLNGVVKDIPSPRVRFELEGGFLRDCSTKQAETSGVVTAVLDGTVDHGVAGSELVIRAKGEGTLTYRWIPHDAASTDPANLVGVTWRMHSVAQKPAAGDGSMRIGKDGTLAGNDGCNDFAGTATVRRGWMRLRATVELRGCLGRNGDQAATVDSLLLGSDAMWTVRDNQLIIPGGGAQAFAIVYTR